MSALKYTVTVDANGVYIATEWIHIGIEPAGSNPIFIGSTEIQDLLNKQAARIVELEAAFLNNSASERRY